ncbi:MAG: polysaccharide biosynthesis/export family protein [Novosphingobium sp.]
MIKIGHLLVLALASLCLVGCQTSSQSDLLPQGPAAYQIAPPTDAAAKPQAYRIGPGDVLSLQVFQEPELSSDKIQVDDVGRIQLPLAGDILAAGLTAPELSAVIAERLGRDYIRFPQVVVGVVSTREQTVAVEGEVKMPGVYKISPSDTLLSAIARAQSPTNVARLDEIIVFRTVNGRRMGARFDLREIRSGQAADPQILGGDVIVVGFSSLKGVYRDILQAAPLLNIFTQF